MVKNTKKKSYAKSYFMIIVGTCVLGFAIQNIYSPIGLVTGGFSGLSIVIKSLTASVVDGGIPLWFSNIMLNVPVFILAFLLKGKKFVGRTFFGTFMLSFWLYVLPCVDLTQGDYMLASIFGGIFAGSGMGLVLRGNATTGGTDMVASLIQIKLKHYSVVEIMQVLDGIIVIVGLVSFGLRPTLYAIVAIYITAKPSGPTAGSCWKAALPFTQKTALRAANFSLSSTKKATYTFTLPITPTPTRTRRATPTPQRT